MSAPPPAFMDLDEITAPAKAKRPYVPNGPEDRFSIAVDRFLKRSLAPPFWCSAINDSDDGTRSEAQRIRAANRGIKSGAIDWDVAQGPVYLHRKLELKRGDNEPRGRQLDNIIALTACGGPPIVAWTLREVYDGLRAAGFRFLPNVETTLQHYEAQLDGWDREASLIRSGAVVKKRAPPRKSGPRYLWRGAR